MFRGKNVVINTGSRATLEPVHGLAEGGAAHPYRGPGTRSDP
jgi:hypothetical protein